MPCLHTALLHDEVVDYLAVVWRICSQSMFCAAVCVWGDKQSCPAGQTRVAKLKTGFAAHLDSLLRDKTFKAQKDVRQLMNHLTAAAHCAFSACEDGTTARSQGRQGERSCDQWTRQIRVPYWDAKRVVSHVE